MLQYHWRIHCLQQQNIQQCRHSRNLPWNLKTWKRNKLAIKKYYERKKEKEKNKLRISVTNSFKFIASIFFFFHLKKFTLKIHSVIYCEDFWNRFNKQLVYKNRKAAECFILLIRRTLLEFYESLNNLKDFNSIPPLHFSKTGLSKFKLFVSKSYCLRIYSLWFVNHNRGSSTMKPSMQFIFMQFPY